MSAVFDFDDDDRDVALRRTSLNPIPCDHSAIDKRVAGNPESDDSNEQDSIAPIPVPQDEKTYEVELGKGYISSSITSTSKTRRKVTKNDFEVLKLLGRGAYGKVMLCRHVDSQRLYAMKVLQKASLVVHAKNAEHTKAERQILEEVKNPFIVQLLYAFQTDARLYLILEYAPGGELFSHMAAEYSFSEETARFYLAEVLMALEHLHGLGIVYRDLKPENCLLNAEGHVLLTDFGLSKVSVDGRTNTICGTTEYMAPEILQELHYDKSVDWWTFGVLMFEMMTGKTPFRRADKNKTLDAIKNSKLNVPYYVSADAKDLIIRLLRKNPNVRLGNGKDGIKRIKAHPFFRKIDWKKAKEKRLTPPFAPKITDPTLAEYFDEKFTGESILESPVEDPSLLKRQSLEAYFQNFSYVANYLSPIQSSFQIPE